MPAAHRTAETWAARLLLVVGVLALNACEVEKRDVGASPPLSPPTGSADQRAPLYASNRYEQSEGGRVFRWMGCDSCHTDAAAGPLNLADDVWRRGGGITDIYHSIAQGAPGMPAYETRIPSQQIWQIAGYVHGLHELKPEVRRRNDNAQSGQPSGTHWSGPQS